MDSINKFKEAAKEFQSDERYLALAAAKKANDEDTVLQQLMEGFSEVRDTLSDERGKDERDDTRVQALNEQLNSVYNDIMTNPNMLAYNKAKEDIEVFMNYVNAIMNAAIDGEDPMAVEPPAMDCCGEEGCASCSGCG